MWSTIKFRKKSYWRSPPNMFKCNQKKTGVSCIILAYCFFQLCIIRNVEGNRSVNNANAALTSTFTSISLTHLLLVIQVVTGINDNLMSISISGNKTHNIASDFDDVIIRLSQKVEVELHSHTFTTFDRRRSSRQLRVISSAIRTMGCLPKYFCGMHAEKKGNTVSTLNNLAYLIKFGLADEDVNDSGNKEKKESFSEVLEKGLPGQYNKWDTGPPGPDLLPFSGFIQKHAFRGKLAPEIRSQMRTGERRTESGILSSILSPFKRMYLRYGRSVDSSRTGRQHSNERETEELDDLLESKEQDEDSNAFWKTAQFKKELKLAATIGQAASSLRTLEQEEICSATFNRCPYSLEEMKGMIEKEKESGKENENKQKEDQTSTNENDSGEGKVLQENIKQKVHSSLNKVVTSAFENQKLPTIKNADPLHLSGRPGLSTNHKATGLTDKISYSTKEDDEEELEPSKENSSSEESFDFQLGKVNEEKDSSSEEKKTEKSKKKSKEDASTTSILTRNGYKKVRSKKKRKQQDSGIIKPNLAVDKFQVHFDNEAIKHLGGSSISVIIKPSTTPTTLPTTVKNTMMSSTTVTIPTTLHSLEPKTTVGVKTTPTPSVLSSSTSQSTQNQETTVEIVVVETHPVTKLSTSIPQPTNSSTGEPIEKGTRTNNNAPINSNISLKTATVLSANSLEAINVTMKNNIKDEIVSTSPATEITIASFIVSPNQTANGSILRHHDNSAVLPSTTLLTKLRETTPPRLPETTTTVSSKKKLTDAVQAMLNLVPVPHAPASVKTVSQSFSQKMQEMFHLDSNVTGETQQNPNPQPLPSAKSTTERSNFNFSFVGQQAQVNLPISEIDETILQKLQDLLSMVRNKTVQQSPPVVAMEKVAYGLSPSPPSFSTEIPSFSRTGDDHTPSVMQSPEVVSSIERVHEPVKPIKDELSLRNDHTELQSRNSSTLPQVISDAVMDPDSPLKNNFTTKEFGLKTLMPLWSSWILHPITSLNGTNENGKMNATLQLNSVEMHVSYESGLSPKIPTEPSTTPLSYNPSIPLSSTKNYEKVLAEIRVAEPAPSPKPEENHHEESDPYSNFQDLEPPVLFGASIELPFNSLEDELLLEHFNFPKSTDKSSSTKSAASTSAPSKDNPKSHVGAQFQHDFDNFGKKYPNSRPTHNDNVFDPFRISSSSQNAKVSLASTSKETVTSSAISQLHNNTRPAKDQPTEITYNPSMIHNLYSQQAYPHDTTSEISSNVKTVTPLSSASSSRNPSRRKPKPINRDKQQSNQDLQPHVHDALVNNYHKQHPKKPPTKPVSDLRHQHSTVAKNPSSKIGTTTTTQNLNADNFPSNNNPSDYQYPLKPTTPHISHNSYPSQFPLNSAIRNVNDAGNRRKISNTSTKIYGDFDVERVTPQQNKMGSRIRNPSPTRPSTTTLRPLPKQTTPKMLRKTSSQLEPANLIRNVSHSYHHQAPPFHLQQPWQNYGYPGYPYGTPLGPWTHYRPFKRQMQPTVGPTDNSTVQNHVTVEKRNTPPSNSPSNIKHITSKRSPNTTNAKVANNNLSPTRNPERESERLDLPSTTGPYDEGQILSTSNSKPDIGAMHASNHGAFNNQWYNSYQFSSGGYGPPPPLPVMEQRFSYQYPPFFRPLYHPSSPADRPVISDAVQESKASQVRRNEITKPSNKPNNVHSNVLKQSPTTKSPALKNRRRPTRPVQISTTESSTSTLPITPNSVRRRINTRRRTTQTTIITTTTTESMPAAKNKLHEISNQRSTSGGGKPRDDIISRKGLVNNKIADVVSVGESRASLDSSLQKELKRMFSALLSKEGVHALNFTKVEYAPAPDDATTPTSTKIHKNTNNNNNKRKKLAKSSTRNTKVDSSKNFTTTKNAKGQERASLNRGHATNRKKPVAIRPENRVNYANANWGTWQQQPYSYHYYYPYNNLPPFRTFPWN